MPRRIDQLVAGFREFDAISNSALLLRDTIRSWGVESNIYCKGSNISVTQHHQARDLKELERSLSTDDIVILHLSIGGEINALFKRLKCKKVIIYHNITPSHFFKLVSSETAAVLDKGRKEMESLAGVAEINLADSGYNAAELKEAGFKDPRVLSLPVDYSSYSGGRIDPVAQSHLTDGLFNILFVGRMAPNKKLEDILTVMAYLSKIEPNVRFVHAGAYQGVESYYGLLLAHAKALNIQNFFFMGAVSQDTLHTCYSHSHAFLCMSEHEGFCVPLVEAMHYRLPILALDSSAVPETLGGSGVLFNSPPNYPLIAETIAEVLHNQPLRESILAKQDKRLDELRNRDLSNELKTLLAPLMV